MDSMAIEGVIFKREYEKVIVTYKRDSTTFRTQIINDSIYKIDLAKRLEKSNAKLKRAKASTKIGIITGLILGLLTHLLF